MKSKVLQVIGIGVLVGQLLTVLFQRFNLGFLISFSMLGVGLIILGGTNSES